jgi:membrane protein DedA with SNARE-associated domain
MFRQVPHGIRQARRISGHERLSKPETAETDGPAWRWVAIWQGEQDKGIPVPEPTHRRLQWVAVGAAVVVAIAVGLALLADSEPFLFHRAIHFGNQQLRHLGPAAGFAALYLEESGAPIPGAGDVAVIYLGHRFAGSTPHLVLVGIGLVVTVVLGSTNLYLISRVWGRQLVQGRFGLLLHVTPERLAVAERWYRRWGPLAIFFGRHIFGLRIPVTVAAGIFNIRYPTFVASVATSTAVWAVFWLVVGAMFGGRLAHVLHLYRWLYLGVPAVIAGLVVLPLVRLWWERRR